MNILLPFDASPAALRAVEFVAGYAGDAARLAVTALNVQPPPVGPWTEAGLMATGRAALDAATSRLAAAGIAAHGDVRFGPAAQTILEEARGADAVVMGTRGGGVLQGFALGSVALRVAHGAAAPVILVKPEDRLPRTLGKSLRVLLAMDGSGPALRAARRLVDWRDWLGEIEVQLVYVQQPLSMLQVMLPPHDDVIRQWSTREGEQATQAARDLFRSAGVAHHLHLTVGDPALEMRTLAQQTGADLVALGTRGLGAAHHALVGSVALKSAALAGVPVMLCA